MKTVILNFDPKDWSLGVMEHPNYSAMTSAQ